MMLEQEDLYSAPALLSPTPPFVFKGEETRPNDAELTKISDGNFVMLIHGPFPLVAFGLLTPAGHSYV